MTEFLSQNIGLADFLLALIVLAWAVGWALKRADKHESRDFTGGEHEQDEL